MDMAHIMAAGLAQGTAPEFGRVLKPRAIMVAVSTPPLNAASVMIREIDFRHPRQYHPSRWYHRGFTEVDNMVYWCVEDSSVPEKLLVMVISSEARQVILIHCPTWQNRGTKNVAILLLRWFIAKLPEDLVGLHSPQFI